jgi:hypothetical protein
MNNLRLIGHGMHGYHDRNNHFPENAVILSADKRPLLSWRVAILPYVKEPIRFNRFQLDEPWDMRAAGASIDVVILYEQFHLNEPWDSPHNKTLIKMMPKVYAHPAADAGKTQEGLTYYRAISGPGTAFLTRNGRPCTIADITDGASNTIMVVEAADPVIWTKPDDLIYDPKQPLPPLGGLINRNLCGLVLCDGSTRYINPREVSERMLRRVITADGGEKQALDSD